MTNRTIRWFDIAVAFVCGSVIAYEPTWWIGVVLAFGGYCIVQFRTEIVPIIVVSIVAISSSIYVMERLPLPVGEEGASVRFFAFPTETVTIDGDTLRGFVKTKPFGHVYVRYRFDTKEEKERYARPTYVGERWLIEGVVQPFERPSHPYAFDMAHYVKMNGGASQVEVTSWEVVGKDRTIRAMMSEWRGAILERIEQYFPEALQAEAKALLAGDKTDWTREEMDELVALGITHLFAISGLHVGLLTLALRAVLLRLSIRHETVRLLLIAGLPFYALLVGGSPSVWRASVMTIVLLLVTDRSLSIRSDDAWSISLIVLLLVKPSFLLYPSFQLSYGATFFILFSSSLLKRMNRPFVQLTFVSFVTEAGLYPLSLYHFYEVSTISLFMNALYVPLYSYVILPMQFILYGLTYVEPLFSFVLFVYEPFRAFVREWTTTFASLPYNKWIGGALSPIAVALLVGWTVVLLVRLETNGRWQQSLLLFALPIAFLVIRPYTDAHASVTFLDVGQGDSIVIEHPYRRQVTVIDTGGLARWEGEEWKRKRQPFEVGTRIVVPYLKARGIGTIDTLVVTHADSDHMEAADELIEQLRVKTLHYFERDEPKRLMEELLRVAERERVDVKNVSAGDEFERSGWTFRYLSPDARRATVGSDNDASLVAEWTNGRVTYVFMGDAEEEAERELAERYVRPAGKVFLKAGHHGSRTSTTERWLDVVRPDGVILSVGRNNRYNHPHDEVIERLTDRGVTIRSTAEEGTIRFVHEK